MTSNKIILVASNGGNSSDTANVHSHLSLFTGHRQHNYNCQVLRRRLSRQKPCFWNQFHLSSVRDFDPSFWCEIQILVPFSGAENLPVVIRFLTVSYTHLTLPTNREV